MGLDIAGLICVAVFGVLGFVRGIFSQAWSLGALVAAYVGADPVLTLVQKQLGGGQEETLIGTWILKLLVGFGLYVVLLLVGFGLEKLLVERFKLVSMSNRILGGVLGLFKGFLTVLVVVWLLLFFFPVHRQGEGVLAQQVASSQAAARALPYNPLNLLLLARVRPYLPQDVTQSKRAPLALPPALEKNELFLKLLQDKAFLEAYKGHEYLSLIRNETFHQVVQNNALLALIEQGAR